MVAGGLATGTRALGVSTHLVKEGYVDLRGAEAKDARDVAALAQVFRDPRFETFRYIYVKDNKYSLRYVKKALKWSQSAKVQFLLEETIQGPEKVLLWSRSAGLQLPLDVTTKGSKTSILSQSMGVNASDIHPVSSGAASEEQTAIGSSYIYSIAHVSTVVNRFGKGRSPFIPHWEPLAQSRAKAILKQV